MSTIKDVAILAGVSPSTVSRVLSDSSRISESTKQRVRDALIQLDYQPNVFARGLVTKIARAIGIFIRPGSSEFFENPFFSEMMRGVAEVTSREGFDTVLSTSARSVEEAIDRMIRGRRVDGVILFSNRKNDPVIQKVIEQKFPATLIGRPEDIRLPICYVNNDNVQAAYEATMHLIHLGHRRIGFLGGMGDLVVTLDRFQGYRIALSEVGIRYDSELYVSTSFLEEGGHVAMKQLMALEERPTAVLASDDVLAFGAMRAVAELGYTIPDDLAIVGFNDIRLAEIANPSLTSVRVNMYDLGVTAAALLIGQIRGEVKAPRFEIVDFELVVRNSCGANKSFISSE